jgi:outer membrane protein W
MKKLIVAAALLMGIGYGANAQVEIGFKLSPNATIGHIKDRDVTSSAVNYTADGATTRESNTNGIGVGFTLDYMLNDNWGVGTGLWFTTKNLHIRNTDGWYTGASKYNILYTQIPVLVKYRTNELFFKNFNLAFSAGGIFDLKTGEKLDGGDGAHYWNLAKNNAHIDPTRGRNGDNRSMALFSPLNVGLYVSAGAEYKFAQNLIAYAGLSVNTSFLNMVNPALKFNDVNLTRVNSDVRFTTTVVSFDLGIKFATLKK